MDNTNTTSDVRLDSRATTTLVFGIIAVAAPLLGLSIVGLVFAIMTLSRLKGARNEAVPDSVYKKLTTARILGIIGLVLSIVFLVVTVIFLIGVIIYMLINGVLAIISAIGVLLTTMLTALTPFLGVAIATLIEQIIAAVIEAVFAELEASAVILLFI